MRWTVPLVLLAVAVGVGLGVSEAVSPATVDGGSPDCDHPEYVEALGPACPTDYGWNVVLDDGSLLHTHGHDSPPDDHRSPEGSSAYLDGAPDAPICVSDTEYHNHLIYARPRDVPSRYVDLKDDLRGLVAEANGFLKEEARQEGYVMEYRFLCEEGKVRVENVTLPHDNADASFHRVVNDLKAKGYDKTTDKYWIWYDDRAGEVDALGTGDLYDDDSDSVDNRNNLGPSYAVTWGILSTEIMMHENGHNLGAVQSSAPHFSESSGGWHCYDEADVMCYGADARRADADQGTNVYCPARLAFDCGKDDYFDPSPESGSYLDTHWNIGSDLNRFVERESCEPYVSSHEAAAAKTGTGEPAGAGPSRSVYNCGSPAAASPGDDAEGHFAAASGTGNSTGWIAASGTGNTSGTVAVSGTGQANGVAAASGTGPATGVVSVAGTEDASSRRSGRCVGAVLVCRPAGVGLASVSGTGAADSCQGGPSCIAMTGTSESRGSHAISGTGQASACDSLCTAVSGTNDSEGQVAVSVFGDASSCTWIYLCVGASGTGQAQGATAVSGCEAVHVSTGSEAACQDVDPEALLP